MLQLIAFKNGYAVRPVPLKNLTLTIFINSIRQLLSDVNLYSKAKKIGEDLNHENGIQSAIEVIENKTNVKQ